MSRRGVSRHVAWQQAEPIFEDAADRQAFVGVVALALRRFDACALAFCLMGNHYHLALHTRQPNLSALMRQINGIYTQACNRRHAKVGHLFQGRFKAILVDRDAYLLEVCRYVDLNPVRAAMVADPAQWPWSSYRAYRPDGGSGLAGHIGGAWLSAGVRCGV
ncbi:transposase [Sulfuriferula sp. GW1]|uniref:transposase n=1 Tax=Sulfuriferula sp. GW1 TaxID=3345111 RepID=UPI0039AFE3AF